ncbi:MAG TPA: radical SAM protein [Terriglobales bacterium]|nr:radical SAM protein [Terriglobales bacterium]
MNTEQFCAPPLTTAGLKAYFVAHGRTAPGTCIELAHFLQADEIDGWLGRFEQWLRANPEDLGPRPVFGFSCYTWNVAELLELARQLRRLVPEALLIAGGPHVQRTEDFLGGDGFDVIVLGEGEITFGELLDCGSPQEWQNVAGCAFRRNGLLQRTPERPRVTALDQFPSPLDVLELRDDSGKPRYLHAAYETSRGCPYRCSFCEWGTGAIGTKMYQFSLARIRSDLERLVEGGIQDIWFCDSNFGALREDEGKAEILIDLKRRSGSPHTFATSWSKNHNRRVQGIVRALHRAGLLWHYHLALQTLTPLALELCHRENMRANEYEPVVKALAAEGVPVACELIWGLPGDSLAQFETNLEHLLTVFPRINIFGYTLLPGTEFFDKRDEYRLETIPVAGYGKAKGEYVVGCHTFPRSEGEEGYFLVTAYLLLGRGQLLASTIQYLALGRRVAVGSLLRACLRSLLALYPLPPHEDGLPERMAIYERRAALYLELLRRGDEVYAVLRRVLRDWLIRHDAAELVEPALQVLAIDEALRPRCGEAQSVSYDFACDAPAIAAALRALELPDPESFARSRRVDIAHPGYAGEVLLDPDGGEWMRGRFMLPQAIADGGVEPAL